MYLTIANFKIFFFIKAFAVEKNGRNIPRDKKKRAESLKR